MSNVNVKCFISITDLRSFEVCQSSANPAYLPYTSGIIYSLFYPAGQYYPHNKDCRWNITMPQNCVSNFVKTGKILEIS